MGDGPTCGQSEDESENEKPQGRWGQNHGGLDVEGEEGLVLISS